jgi:hypothetical protein
MVGAGIGRQKKKRRQGRMHLTAAADDAASLLIHCRQVTEQSSSIRAEEHNDAVPNTI